MTEENQRKIIIVKTVMPNKSLPAKKEIELYDKDKDKHKLYLSLSFMDKRIVINEEENQLILIYPEIIDKYKDKLYYLKFNEKSIVIDGEEEKLIKDYMDNYELELKNQNIKLAYEKFIWDMKLLFDYSNKLLFNEKDRRIYANDSTKNQLFKFTNGLNIYETIHENIVHPYDYYMTNKEKFLNKITCTFCPTDKLFNPYRSYDYSFLDLYKSKVKETIIKQIELDSNGYCEISKYNDVYIGLDLIEDLVQVLEFFCNPNTNNVTKYE